MRSALRSGWVISGYSVELEKGERRPPLPTSSVAGIETPAIFVSFRLVLVAVLIGLGMASFLHLLQTFEDFLLVAVSLGGEPLPMHPLR